MTAPSDPTPSRRFIGCLVKGPLGCLAFLAGAAFVFVLFLPPVVGRLTKRHLNDWFGKAFHGSLEVGEAWLGSVYGNQRVDGLILRDPEGGEVLNATVSAPPVPFAGGDGELGGWGPVEVSVHLLSIIQNEDGRTNLERAFEPRSTDHRTFSFRPSAEELDFSLDDVEFSFDEDRFELRMPASMRFEIVIERLRWIDARRNTIELEDLRLDATLSEGDSGGMLVLRGSTGIEEGTLALTYTLPDLFTLGDPNLATAWSFQCDGRDLPSRVFEVLLGSGAWLGTMLGERLDEAHLTLAHDRSDELRIENLGLVAGGTAVSLAGTVHTEERRLHGRADDELRIDLSAREGRASELIPQLVPLFDSFEPTSDEGVSLVLSNFRLDFGRLLDGLSASVVLASGPARWRLDGGLRDLVGLQGEAPPREFDSLRLELGLHEGRARFDSQKILGGGESYLLSGDYLVLDRFYKGLGVRLPPAILPSNPGEKVLTGDRDAPLLLE